MFIYARSYLDECTHPYILYAYRDTESDTERERNKEKERQNETEKTFAGEVVKASSSISVVVTGSKP